MNLKPKQKTVATSRDFDGTENEIDVEILLKAKKGTMTLILVFLTVNSTATVGGCFV